MRLIPQVRDDNGNIFTVDAGTWTPDFNPSSGSFGSIVYSIRDAYYYKIGRLVIVTAAMATTSLSFGSASGSVRISGLPFPSTGTYKWAGKVSSTSGWGGEDANAVQIIGSSTLVRLYYRTTADGVQNNETQTTDMLTGPGNNIIFSITYLTD